MWMSDVASIHGEVGGHDKFYLKKNRQKICLLYTKYIPLQR